jgi:signal transduction histidine kinase
MHSLLQQQFADLGLLPDSAPTLDDWRTLLVKVGETYEAADEDRALLRRSLALSSAEMSALYESLRSSSEAALLENNRELELSLARADAIMEAVVDGIVVIRADGKIVTANRRFAELWSLPPRLLAMQEDGSLLGHVIDQLLDSEQFLARIHHLMDNPHEHAMDEVQLKNGSVFERYSGPVLISDGELFGRIWCFRDVTQERKLATERLIVSERLASLGRLTASVAHELNNPLAYVCTNLDLLGEQLGARGSLGEQTSELLDDVREGLERITAIVRDLRSSSRTPEEDRETVDIESPLNIAIQMASNEIRHRARLIREIPSGMLVRANAMRLGQVFLNLLVNAAQAISEGHAQENTISVRVSEENGQICVRISDTGTGINPENMERIFDPFFTTKPIGVGTGLGLSICRNIVDGYGGSISVSNDDRRGAIFTVRLPMAVELVGPPSQKPPRHRVVDRQCRVLVIDDEPAILRAIRRVLTGSHQVVTCERAREALLLFEAGEVFDVIICDVMMPDMTGVEFYEKICASFPELSERLVFMTGGALSLRAEAFIMHVGQVLEKPLRATDIRDLVSSLRE